MVFSKNSSGCWFLIVCHGKAVCLESREGARKGARRGFAYHVCKGSLRTKCAPEYSNEAGNMIELLNYR